MLPRACGPAAAWLPVLAFSVFLFYNKTTATTDRGRAARDSASLHVLLGAAGQLVSVTRWCWHPRTAVASFPRAPHQGHRVSRLPRSRSSCRPFVPPRWCPLARCGAAARGRCSALPCPVMLRTGGRAGTGASPQFLPRLGSPSALVVALAKSRGGTHRTESLSARAAFGCAATCFVLLRSPSARDPPVVLL